MEYLFKTKTTMKEYNNDKYWIDSDIINQILIDAIGLKNALEKYVTIVNRDGMVKISKNAIRNKAPMYIDINNKSEQIGYVITASSLFNIDYEWKKQFIDLWVEIVEVKNPFC